MADFVSQLQSMLGGGAQPDPSAMGMTNYGAAPTAQGLGGTILARLNPGGTAYSLNNPRGVTPPAVGGNIATAISGLSAVDPTASKFGAFAQGLAGGLAQRQNAEVQNASFAIQRQHAGLEALKQQLAIQQMQRQMAGTSAAAAILNGGAAPGGGGIGGAPMSTPSPSPLGGGTMPQGGGGGMPPPMPPGGPMPMQGGGAAAPMPVGAPMPGGQPQPPMAGGAPMQPAAADPAAAPAGPIIPRENTPSFILARAAKLAAASDAALTGGNQELGGTLQARAAAEQQRATAMLNSGKTMDAQGNVVPLPGFMKTEADQASAKKGAEIAAENAGKPVMNPDGSTYIPAPGSSAPSGSGAPQAPTIGNSPTKAQIDPQTAAIATSIPSAPAGGGYPMPNLPAGAKLVGVGENAKETAKADAGFDDIIGKAPAVDQAVERYKAAAQALKLVQSGAGGDTLNKWGAYAQAIGAPDSIVQGLARGDPAAGQWLAKEGVGLTLDTLKAAQPRFAQAEFNKVAEKGVPSIDSTPQANHQLITEGLGSALRSQAFMRDWQVANKNGWTSPSAFYTSWSAQNPQDAFTRAAQRQIGTFKGMHPPSPDQWTVGATYVAPSDLSPAAAASFAKRGVQGGQLFRYNGPKAAQAISPVAPADNFSDHITGGQP